MHFDAITVLLSYLYRFVVTTQVALWTTLQRRWGTVL